MREVRKGAASIRSSRSPCLVPRSAPPLRPHPLLKGIAVGPQGLHGYFVHSYHLKVADRHDLVAEADYGGPVTAMVARETYAGTQFHPEKSQRLGLALIANFLKWTP